jgi:ABC-type cobalamin/Fe3+-siderophores transport system ATPase subunit
MRLARSNDIWRELYRDQTALIESLTVRYQDVVGLGSGEATFSHPMSLICGENGVGKTTLLRLINRALNQGREIEIERINTYKKGPATGQILECILRMRTTNGAVTVTQADLIAKNKAESEWLDVSFVETVSIVPHLQRLYSEDANRGDLLEGVTARELKDDDLQIIRQLVGRDYDRVEIFEIAEYANFERVPYFRVSESGVSYGSEGMGTGELALLHLFWEITSSTSNSVLLLEEPESFVAPRSQRIFIDWLASVALERKLFVILASHSGHIAERFPAPPTILCTRGNGRVVLESNPAGHVLADRLGILSHRRTIALAEDEAAVGLTKGLLQELEPKIMMECELVVAGSNGDIERALNNFPTFDSNRFMLIGVFDGDQPNRNFPWPSVRLPGTNGPEALIRALCLGSDPAAVAAALGFRTERWEAALGGAAGSEDHDWLTRILSELGLNADGFFARLAPLLVLFEQPESRRFAAEFAAKVRRR